MSPGELTGVLSRPASRRASSISARAGESGFCLAQTYADQNTDYSRDLGAEDNQVEKPGMVHDQRAPIAQDERNLIYLK